MKDNALKIGLALNNIALSCDDATLDRIRPYIKAIEDNMLEVMEKYEKAKTEA